MKYNYFLKLLSFFIVAIIFFNSCKQDEKIAPVLPPESAFVTDFSDFNSSQKTRSNFNFAAFNVWAWNTIIRVGLAVPVLSYVEAVKNNTPVYQDDNTWLWSYKFGTDYTAKLYGTLEEDSARWQMYITKTGSYTDFLWYEGKSALAATGGYWILYDAPPVEGHTPVQLLSINWTRNSDKTGHIKYQNIKAGDDEEGGYIEYGDDNGYEQVYKTFYHIYNKGQENLTSIEWDKSTKEGHVKDKKYFSDELWHCWDSSLENIDCEELFKH